MADPFQNVDAAGPEFIKIFADSMDVRQSDPAMEAVVAAYLDALEFDGLTIEVGSGAGAVARRIAARAEPGLVKGFDPSSGFVAEARERAKAHANLSFDVANGSDLPLEDASVANVIQHTVLSHVTDPMALIREAVRVLRSGGRLVICDADFSKASLANFANDPLDMCAREFVSQFVTDPDLVGRLRPMVLEAGLELISFDARSRLCLTPQQMRPWVEMANKGMVERGEIGQPLADALASEYERRAKAGTLYGFQLFATLIAEKP